MLNYGPNLGVLIDAALGEEHYDAQRRFLRLVDGLVQPIAKSFDQIAPSGTDVDGDVHIVGAGAVGPWAGRDGWIARYYTVGIGAPNWDFFEPREGWTIRTESFNNSFGVPSLAVYRGGEWVIDSANPDLLDPVDLPLNGADQVVIFRDGRMYRSSVSSLGGEGVSVDASNFDANVPYITWADVDGKIRLNLVESGLKTALALNNVNNTSDADKPISILQQAAFDGKISTSQKGVAGGVAPLNELNQIPSIHLPSYVDDVIEVANFAALPVTGEGGKIYITLDTDTQYRWSGSVYTAITSSPGSTDDVPEGAVNLYFTEPRTLATILTGFVAATSGFVVDATDSILGALQKIQGRLAQLGTAANRNVTVGTTDTTANRVLKVGDFGIGALGGVTPVSDFNTIARNGYFEADSSFTVGSPVTEAEVMLTHVGYSSTDATQTAISRTSGRSWDRVKNNAIWAPWFERYTTGNTSSMVQSFLGLANPSAERFVRFNADNSASLLDAAGMRLALGVGTGSGSVTAVGMTVPAGFDVTGSPITTSGTFAITFASGYSLPSNASQATWNAAYSQSGQWNGGSTGLNQGNGRTSLGLVSVAWTGSAADLTTGTLADTRLPASQTGKTFTSMVTVNAATGQILDLKAATDANGYATFRNAAGTAIGYLGTANGGASSGGAATDFAVNAPGVLNLISGSGSITLNAASVTAVGAVAAASFSGSGESITNLSASNITAGTLADARLPSTLTSKTIDGSLTFTGNARRILGDFSNATLANRVSFQSSSGNGRTAVQAIPNGTSTIAQFIAYNGSDPANASSFSLSALSTTSRIESTASGTGTINPIEFLVGGVQKLTIPASGNILASNDVQINAASGQASLHLSQAGTINGRIYAGGGAGTDVVVSALRYASLDGVQGSQLNFNGSNKLITTSAGVNVTGNLSASASFINGSGAGQVVNYVNGGNSGTAAGAATYYQNAGVTNGAVGHYSAIVGGAYSPQMCVWSSSSIGFVVNSQVTPAVTIHANGKMTIGSAVDAGLAKLEVTGNILSTAAVMASGAGGFQSSTYVTNARNPIWRFGNADSYGLSYFQGSAGYGGQDSLGIHLGATTAVGSQLNVRVDGVFVLGTLACTGALTCATWTATSDQRLKENIKQLSLAECKEILAKVNWCSFDLIDGQKNLNGVIAQELMGIYPDAVVKDEGGQYSVNYNLLYNLQMRVNQDLEQRLARLERLIEGASS